MHGQGSTTFRFSLLEQWTLAEMRVMIYLTPNYIQYRCWQKITKCSINSRYRRLLDQQIQHIHHNYTVHERFAELSLSMSKQRRWKQAYWRVLGPGIGHLPVPALCLAVWINSGGLSLTFTVKQTDMDPLKLQWVLPAYTVTTTPTSTNTSFPLIFSASYLMWLFKIK